MNFQVYHGVGAMAAIFLVIRMTNVRCCDPDISVVQYKGHVMYLAMLIDSLFIMLLAKCR